MTTQITIAITAIVAALMGAAIIWAVQYWRHKGQTNRLLDSAARLAVSARKAKRAEMAIKLKQARDQAIASVATVDIGAERKVTNAIDVYGGDLSGYINHARSRDPK